LLRERVHTSAPRVKVSIGWLSGRLRLKRSVDLRKCGSRSGVTTGGKEEKTSCEWWAPELGETVVSGEMPICARYSRTLPRGVVPPPKGPVEPCGLVEKYPPVLSSPTGKGPFQPALADYPRNNPEVALGNKGSCSLPDQETVSPLMC